MGMEEKAEPDQPTRSTNDLLGQLAGLFDIEPGDMADAVVIEGLVDLIDLAGRVDAAVARFASVFDSRALGAVDGARTTGSWLAARTELSAPASSAVVRQGHRLDHCPHIEAAARSGRLGVAKVRRLLDARVDVEDLFALCEADLVDATAPLTVAHAFGVIDDWRRVALATADLDDGPEPAGDTGRNQLHLSKTFQGRWVLNGDLDSLNGEALANTINDWIDRRIKCGTIDPSDPRGRPGQRADALCALTGNGSEGGGHQPRAHINLHWDADHLLGTDIAELADLDRRRCNTSGGATLAHDRATELMCNADITDLLIRFGYHNSRSILGVTHTRRHPTDYERRALDQRDQGCVFPGCTAPTSWCHAHHITPYEIGRTTTLDDLVLLCGHHHRAIHRDFHLTKDHATGHITVARPDGTIIETSHPARRGTKLPLDRPVTNRTAPPDPGRRTRFSSEYLQPPDPNSRQTHDRRGRRGDRASPEDRGEAA